MSNPFLQLANTKVMLIDKAGKEYGPFQSTCSNTKATLWMSELPVEEGDKLVKLLPEGAMHYFTIQECKYVSGFYSIPQHFVLMIHKDNSIVPTSGHSTVVHNSGQNSRFNLNSVNTSSNIILENSIFLKLRETLNQHIADKETVDKLTKLVNAMEQSKNTPAFTDRYAEFVQNAANHMTILAPFFPLLADFFYKAAN